MFLLTATQIGLSLEGATSLLSEESQERWSASDVRQMALLQRELQSLCLDSTEFALLKAAVLFSPPCKFQKFSVHRNDATNHYRKCYEHSLILYMKKKQKKTLQLSNGSPKPSELSHTFLNELVLITVQSLAFPRLLQQAPRPRVLLLLRLRP